MRILGVGVAYALSPQAKGKVERPYRWSQTWQSRLEDQIVRTCAPEVRGTCVLEKLTTLQEARAVLKEEVDRYKNHQVHSTAREIPSIRFEKARRTGNSLFRPFCLPKPYTSPKDVSCLQETRMVNGYWRISLFNHTIEVPKVPLYEHVEIHLIPDTQRQTMDVRIWRHGRMVHSVTYPLRGFRVHF